MVHSTVWRVAGFEEMKESKRGSVFVEAALVFPLLIVTAALLINYTVEHYEEIREQTESHERQREASMKGQTISKGECEFVRNIDFLLEEI